MNVRPNVFKTARGYFKSFAALFFALGVCLLIYTYVRRHYPTDALERMKLINTSAQSAEGVEGAGN
jgi:hypothetical protein